MADYSYNGPTTWEQPTITSDRVQEIGSAGLAMLGEVTSQTLTVGGVEPDMVNHPPHYTSDPSGVECITITRHRNFNIGNAIKYLWRAGLKVIGKGDPVDKQIEDLRKAIFYIEDEINRLDSSR